MSVQKVFIAAGFVIVGLLGLFFITNIYVLGDTDSAVAMHDDIYPQASPVLVQMKVILTFLAGGGYVLSCIGWFLKKRKWLLWGGLAGIVYFAAYIGELALWADVHQRIWIDFATFGHFTLWAGVYCLYMKGKISLNKKA